jgi:hypothetical protein
MLRTNVTTQGPLLTEAGRTWRIVGALFLPLFRHPKTAIGKAHNVWECFEMALNVTLQMLIGRKASTTLLHSGFLVGAFGWLRSFSFESKFTPVMFLARGDQESTFVRLDLDMYSIDMCLEM